MNKQTDLIYQFILFNPNVKDHEITKALNVTSRDIRYAREEINSNIDYELSVDFSIEGRTLTNDYLKLKKRLLKTMRKQWKQLKKCQHYINTNGQVDMFDLLEELEEE
jgi:hypothetical protein